MTQYGKIDCVTSLGYIEGWAYDTERLTVALPVSVKVDEVEVAYGSAHLYRADLSFANCGSGWCAFRVKSTADLAQLLGKKLRLYSLDSKRALFETTLHTQIEDPESSGQTSFSAITNEDPTIIKSLDQLVGCQSIFLRYLRNHGVEAFVRAAYVYVLGRPADLSGLTHYSRCLRFSTLTPYAILIALTDSDEFRSRTRQLGAPNTNSFPFQ